MDLHQLQGSPSGVRPASWACQAAARAVLQSVFALAAGVARERQVSQVRQACAVRPRFIHAAAMDHLRGVLLDTEQGAIWDAGGVGGADWARLQGPL